jgi:hypothetical protein
MGVKGEEWAENLVKVGCLVVERVHEVSKQGATDGSED